MSIREIILPLPDVDGTVECVSGVLQLVDKTSDTASHMLFSAGAVSAVVTDGVTTAPAVTGNVGDTLTLDITGLSAANTPWTVTETVTAISGGQTVTQSESLEISPCVGDPIVAAGTSALAVNVYSFTSTSTPTDGTTLDLLRYTLTFSDPGFPNDGRVIVVEAASHAAAPAVISDTGGTPAARLDTPELTGTGAAWSFTADVNNDVVLTAGGSLTTDLLARDTSTATDTALDI